MGWMPGISGNELGRPPEDPDPPPKRRKRVYTARDPLTRPSTRKRIKLVVEPDENGHVDPLACMQATIDHPDVDVRLKVAASAGLAKFKYPPAQRWIPEPLDLSAPTNAREAMAAAAKIWELMVRKRISMEMGADLLAPLRAFSEMHSATELADRIARLEQFLDANPPPAPPAEVVNPLPPLRGTNIIMPDNVVLIRPGEGPDGGSEPPQSP
jgi:hypothetical protein